METEEIFRELDKILLEGRKRGVIVDETDPITGEEITWKIRMIDGREVREQLFPPPSLPPRRKLRAYPVTGATVLALYVGSGIAFVLLARALGLGPWTVGEILLVTAAWPLLAIVYVLVGIEQLLGAKL